MREKKPPPPPFCSAGFVVGAGAGVGTGVDGGEISVATIRNFPLHSLSIFFSFYIWTYVETEVVVVWEAPA